MGYGFGDCDDFQVPNDDDVLIDHEQELGEIWDWQADIISNVPRVGQVYYNVAPGCHYGEKVILAKGPGCGWVC